MDEQARFRINPQSRKVEKETFPEDSVIEYLRLKSQSVSREEIIEKMKLGSDYVEERLRKYILQKMECSTINQAVLEAYKANWFKA